MMGAGHFNLITTTIGFGISAVFIVYICASVLCRRLRGSSTTQQLDIESTTDLQLENRSRGLEPVLLDVIPSFKFTREACDPKEEPQCSICLGEYEEKEVLRTMPRCGHTFHLSCIDVWLTKQATCPVCRFPLQNFIELRQATIADLVQSPGSPDDSIENSHQWLVPNVVPSESIQRTS